MHGLSVINQTDKRTYALYNLIIELGMFEALAFSFLTKWYCI
ncbi:MAG: hypothetical protein JWO06_4091 [Bacteroidota bacterium]|nr:hypothetical protein [Bacteroidota bacterium]